MSKSGLPTMMGRIKCPGCEHQPDSRSFDGQSGMYGAFVTPHTDVASESKLSVTKVVQLMGKTVTVM